MRTSSPQPIPRIVLSQPKALHEIGPSSEASEDGLSENSLARTKGFARRIPSSEGIRPFHPAGDASVFGGGTIGPYVLLC